MNYNLNQNFSNRINSIKELTRLKSLIKGEHKNLILALIIIIVSAGLNLLTPFLIGRAVDRYIANKDYHGVLIMALVLLAIYVTSLILGYIQTMVMGGIGQRMLYNLRIKIFTKIQSLPIAFFNQNKSGDLISRINNDTDKLNQFFSQSLMQFIGSIFIMLGAGIFLLLLNFKLGLAVLVPALFVFIFTKITSSWVAHKNSVSLKSVGGLSAEIQESLDNFKVVIAFNRRDYFRNRFTMTNNNNYQNAISSGIANGLFTPVYGLASNSAQLVTIAFGIYLIIHGDLTIGLLISYISYVNNFYNPMRQLAALWTNFQVAMAGWRRVSEILSLKSDLEIMPSQTKTQIDQPVLTFKNVTFEYEDGKVVLNNISFNLEKGKTYALVGPTGGGKTTTASLMARLYDPTRGEIYFKGQNLKSLNDLDRTQKIGFILQEPFLFDGTVADNILYANDLYKNISQEELNFIIKEKGLSELLARFDQGLNGTLQTTSDSVSLGQKQLIAFMRAILREPEILILDEATANIDTVTEKLLERALEGLPVETTKIIIAHRLNTIENADTIFFVNNRQVKDAGNLTEALNLLLYDERKS